MQSDIMLSLNQFTEVAHKNRLPRMTTFIWEPLKQKNTSRMLVRITHLQFQQISLCNVMVRGTCVLIDREQIMCLGKAINVLR